jgi:hypothetical protein
MDGLTLLGLVAATLMRCSTPSRTAARRSTHEGELGPQADRMIAPSAMRDDAREEREISASREGG